jgi:Lar family restriction alleviation protein
MMAGIYRGKLVTTMAELKPCPFCGWDDLAILPDDAKKFVYCCKCDTCGPSCETRRESIEAWNRRDGEQK